MAIDDSYSKILLHCDGDDASTTITDEAGNTWTAEGGAQIDTAQSKFGGASLLLDGNGDYISTPDSDDWRLDDGDNSKLWTIDFWVRFNSVSGYQALVAQLVNGSNNWMIQYESTHELTFQQRVSGTRNVNIRNAWTPSTGQWYHVAVVKNGTSGYLMFVDGTQIGSTQTDTDTIGSFAGALNVGRSFQIDGAPSYLNGWIDEFRVSKGVARWTSNFTPPTSAYGGGGQVIIWSSE
ncbi:MAG: LamG domain-containing protein [Candidatus Paceibacterota bacterium]|jgi:hypothetical protein